MKRKILSNFTKAALFLAVIWFVAKSIFDNYGKIKDIDLTAFDPFFMFVSVVLMFISLIFPVFVWRYLISVLGEKINAAPALGVWFLANLGRYVPGKVWQLAGLVYFAGKEGVKKSKAVESVLYSQIISNLLGLIIGLSLLSSKSISDDFPNSYHITALIIVIFFFMLWFPTIIFRSSNFVLEKFKKEKLSDMISGKHYGIYVILQFFNWFLMSFTFVFFIKAYTDISISLHPEVLFILPLSWTIGLLAVFAPGGIGVREGTMSFWLSTVIPLEYALMLPWIYRIIITIVEIILTLIFGLGLRKPEKYGITSHRRNKQIIK